MLSKGGVHSHAFHVGFKNTTGGHLKKAPDLYVQALLRTSDKEKAQAIFESDLTLGSSLIATGRFHTQLLAALKGH